MLLVGTYPIHDLPDIGVDSGNDDEPRDYITVAGLLLARLGHIPKAPGETVELPGFHRGGRRSDRTRDHPGPPPAQGGRGRAS